MDQYAIVQTTQVRFHGLDPEKAIIEIHPRAGERCIREADILEAIEKERNELALVLFGGINYYTGQFFDLKAITQAAHKAGARAGFDLAHAAGNIPLSLCMTGMLDFAVWCSYKYLSNAGPGATGGAFIHERFAANAGTRRIGGWWGNDEKTRFKMEKGFIPKEDAHGWNISTAQVFNMVCLESHPLKYLKRRAWKKSVLKASALRDGLENLLGPGASFFPLA